MFQVIIWPWYAMVIVDPLLLVYGCVTENGEKTPLYPMVLLIIIPTKWLFHWEYTLFSDKPIFEFCVVMPSGFTKALKLVECVEMPTHGDVGMVCWGWTRGQRSSQDLLLIFVNDILIWQYVIIYDNMWKSTSIIYNNSIYYYCIS